jgi:hypothetical protein
MVTANAVPRELPSWAKDLLENLGDSGAPRSINDYVQFMRRKLPDKFDPAFTILGTMESPEEEALVCDLAWSSWLLLRSMNDLVAKQCVGLTQAEVLERFGETMVPVAATMQTLVNLANLRDGARNGHPAHRVEGTDGGEREDRQADTDEPEQGSG